MTLRLSTGRRLGGDQGEVENRVTRQGYRVGVQGLPPYAVPTALGYGARADCTTAVATVVAIPTTTAMFTLWNGDVERSYVIDQMIASTWASDNKSGGMFIVASIHPVGMAQPSTQDITPIKLNANGLYGGNAWCDVGATVVNNGWTAWGGITQTISADSTPSTALVAPVEGRIVIPPRAGVSMSVVSHDADVTVKCGFLWYEVLMDLG